MTDLVAVPVPQSPPVTFTDEQRATLANTIARDAQGPELDLFVAQCERTGLDPFTRQIYFIRMKGRPKIVVSIDGFRLIAERSNVYGGQLGPQWCDASGEWRDVWLSNDAPAACRVGVVRKDWDAPLWGVVTWAEFGRDSETWGAMPAHMLAKVAESHALRKAFPNEMSGLYTADEMRTVKGAKIPEERTRESVVADILKRCDDMPPENCEKLRVWVEEKLEVPFTAEGLAMLPESVGDRVLRQAHKAQAAPVEAEAVEVPAPVAEDGAE